MKNQFGVCEWSLPVNGPASVALAAAAGFDGIQIGDLGGEEQGFPMSSPAIREGYLQAAADCRVTLHSLHPYGLQREGTMLYPLGTPQGDRGRDSVIRCIDTCAAMSIPTLMLSSFFATLVRNDWDFDVFAGQLAFACRYGRDHGVRIVYESVLSPERILRMIEATRGELTICYDILNPIRWGTGNPQTEIPTLGLEHIDHFHVKDAPDDLKGYALLGQGRGAFADAVRLIRQLGYSGWLVSENYYTLLSAGSGEDFLELARRDCRALRSAFGD